MRSFKSAGVFKHLSDRHSNEQFCRFGCVLLRECFDVESNSELRAAILRHLREKVLSKFNVLELLGALDQGTSAFVLEKISELEDCVHSATLELLKKAHLRRAELQHFRDHNPIFRLCLDTFIDDKLPRSYLDIYGSFLRVDQRKHKRRFLQQICKFDKELFRQLLRRWLDEIASLGDLRDVKLFADISLKAIRSEESLLDCLEGLISRIQRELPVDKASAMYDHLELVLGKKTHPGQVLKLIRAQRKKFFSSFEVRFSKHAWEEYMRVVPQSKFSRQLLKKVLTDFDDYVDRLDIESESAFKKRISGLELMGRERFEVVSKLISETETKPGHQDPFDERNSIQRLVLLNRLHWHSDARVIFDCVMDACEADDELKQSVMQSKLVGVLVKYIGKVHSGELTVDEMFILDQFGLGLLLRRSVLFQVHRHMPASHGRSAELLEHQRAFDEALALMRTKVRLLEANRKLFQALKSHRLLKALLGESQAQAHKKALTANWNLNANFGAPVELPAQMGSVKLEKLQLLECPVMFRVFLMLCFREKHLSVFRDLPGFCSEELQALCGYFGVDQSELEKSTSYLPLADLNGLIEQTCKYHAYLETKYFSKPSYEFAWDMHPPEHTGLCENLVFFEILLSQMKGQNQSTSSRAQSTELRQFATQIADLAGLQKVKTGLKQLPEPLRECVSEHVTELDDFARKTREKKLPVQTYLAKQATSLARLEQIRSLAGNELICELFEDELKGQIESLCRNPFDQLNLGRRLNSLDVAQFEQVLADEVAQKVLSILVLKLRDQKSLSESLLLKLDRKARKFTKLKRQVKELRIEKSEFSKKQFRLLGRLDQVLRLSSVAGTTSLK